MAGIEFRIVGDNKLVGTLRNVSDNLFEKIRGALERDVLAMHKYIIKSMQHTKRASWFYSRQQGKKKHFPSLPFNFPAVDSGELWKHILVDVNKKNIEIGPGNAVPYAKFLENPKGTKYMKARSFLKPTWKKFKPTIKENIINTIAKEFKK